MSRSLIVPEITVDRSLQLPLQQQIVSQLADAIRKGDLPEGARLPSSRLLATLLRVSRNTVVLAYEDLVADGLLQARAGSGVQVSGIRAMATPNLPRLRRTLRASHYPLRTQPFEDPDGTPLYLNLKS